MRPSVHNIEVPPPNIRDAAILLLSLGEQAAADVLRHLGPKDVQRVGKAMSSVGPLTVTQVSQTISTFLQEVRTAANRRQSAPCVRGQ